MPRRLQVTLSVLGTLALVIIGGLPAHPAHAATGGLTVRYHTYYGPVSNQIGPLVDLTNTGSAAVPLSSVTIRYWFTADGTSPPRYFCDYTPRGCGSVTARFVTLPASVPGADTYLELGFTAAAGSLAPGQSTGDIQGRVAKADWSPFNQADDYSYDGTRGAATAWDHITGYLNGTLAWGSEPAGAGPDNQAPTAPAGLAVIGVTGTSATLVWQASSDNVGVTGYDVYAGTTLAASVAGTSATVSNLAAGTAYTFTVRARDAAGNTSPASGAVTATAGDVRPADWVVYAFSQSNVDEEDPQVYQLAPDISIRAIGKWSTNGDEASDYNFAQIGRYHDKGVPFVGGGTASVILPQDFATPAIFDDMSTRDADNQPVPHDELGFTQNARRGNLFNPKYRDYLLSWARIQIDGGVDGLFFDELISGFSGGQKYNYNGNEGFDDYTIADFNRYLLAKYPAFTAADWTSRFGMTDDNLPRADVAPDDLAHNFNYRTYLRAHGWDTNPLTAANPLAVEWGDVTDNRMYADDTSFTGTYLRMYWKQMVDGLRAYTMDTYHRRLLITSNGLFPYVDFNSVGMYPWNPDERTADGKGADYVPVVGGHLNGAKSLQANYRYLKDKNTQIAGDVPVAVFIDWPTDMMTAYLNLPLSEKQDYWRIFGAEAYANGIFPTFHLKDTLDPTASQYGMLDFFQTYSRFYTDHRSLFQGNDYTTTPVTVGVGNVSTSLLVQRGTGARTLHLVNHNYDQAIQPQTGFTVTAAVASCPTTVSVVSPDFTGTRTPAFSCRQGSLTVTVDRLDYYDILVLG